MEAARQNGGATGSVHYHLRQAGRENQPEYCTPGRRSSRSRPEHPAEGALGEAGCCPVDGASDGQCAALKVHWAMAMQTAVDHSVCFPRCLCGSMEPLRSDMPYCTACLTNTNNGEKQLATSPETCRQEVRAYSEQAEDSGSSTMFHVLPWYDIIFTQLCRCLTLQEVFQLRATCRLARNCIDEYFNVCPHVDLTRCGLKMTPSAFQMVTYNNYKLHTLILRGVKVWLTDAVLIPAFATSSHLTKVDLTNCSSLTPRSVVALACHAHTLQELRLRECGWVTKECVLIVAQCCHHLLKLDLTGCWAVDDETVVTISISCQQLISLSIAKIYGITDFSVRHISHNCPRLQHINMQGCWRVTNAAIHRLGECCKQLRVLQVKECRDVTESSLSRLRMRGVELDVPNPNHMFLGSSRSLMEKLKLQV